MITLELRFSAGAYHATPWGRHVNEGLTEWPPSPWRFLRALIAVWHRKVADWPENEVRDLIGKLTAPPSFRLPPATLAHTRHFMPAPEKKTKVFDAFVALDRTIPVLMVWPDLELSKAERLLLESLLRALSYLGRSESWVEATLAGEPGGPCNAFPVQGRPDPGSELVPVLTALSPNEYAVWADGWRAAEKMAGAGTGRRKSAGGHLPADLWEALHVETDDLQAAGWSLPPAARWVDYARPSDAFQVSYGRRTSQRGDSPTVARFALVGKPLPRLTETLWVGEKMRQALMHHSRGLDGGEHALSIFSGKGPQGEALADDHAHAFYLASDDDGDGYLDHVTVYSTAGFDFLAQKALAKVDRLWDNERWKRIASKPEDETEFWSKLWREGGPGDLTLVLVGLGAPYEYGGFSVKEGESPLLAKSRYWISRTPYLLTRHPKTYRDGRPKLDEQGLQIDGPEAQLRLELRRRGLPAPEQIERLQYTEAPPGHRLSWLEFRRERRHGAGKLAGLQGHGFRLAFPEPVWGPVAIGYAGHFGLGQFVAVERLEGLRGQGGGRLAVPINGDGE